jgi:hypothetical protein
MPLAVAVFALFDAGEDQSVHLATLRRLEVHAHTLAGEQVLVRAQLGQQGAAGRI